MANLLQQFLTLVPGSPLLVGEVTGAAGEVRKVTLPDGSEITARGNASLGDKVFVRAGSIDGPAPILPFVEIVI